MMFKNAMMCKKMICKKRAGRLPCSKNCVDPISPKFGFDLDGRGDAACARRAPPETWTTRHQPCGRPEAPLVDHLFRLVINFSNDCSKFEHGAKSLEFALTGGCAWDARSGTG